MNLQIFACAGIDAFQKFCTLHRRKKIIQGTVIKATVVLFPAHKHGVVDECVALLNCAEERKK
ncbi:hypothetical protein EBR21_13770 [bacterium]|nr:hypothetical protein [bacterium]